MHTHLVQIVFIAVAKARPLFRSFLKLVFVAARKMQAHRPRLYQGRAQYAQGGNGGG